MIANKFLEWSDELSVGIAEIDAQHQILVDLLNEIHEAIREGTTVEVTKGIIDRLDQYTRIHFAVEECLMRILDYPDYERHKQEHDKLLTQLTELHIKLEKGKGAIGFELAFFLKGWITQHILEGDQRYAAHFLSRGIRSDAEPKSSWAQRVWNLLGKR